MIDEIATQGSAMVEAIEAHLDGAYDAYLCRQIAMAFEEHEQETRQRRYRRIHIARQVIIVASVILGAMLVGVMVAELFNR
jgi:hypothetical protein